MIAREKTSSLKLWTPLLFVLGILIPGQVLNGLAFLLFDVQWYEDLVKPWFHPPGFWFFILVFVINYTGMGIAAWLVWQQRHRVSKVLYGSAICVFLVQLFVGYAWSLSVHATESIFLGYLLDLIADGFYILTMILFFRLSKAAFWWLVPAAVWFAFTTYLKFVMWQLN